jgi:hypothetical protein
MDKITTVRIQQDLLDAAEKLYRKEGIRPSESIRRGLELWLEKKGVYKPKKEKNR